MTLRAVAGVALVALCGLGGAAGCAGSAEAPAIGTPGDAASTVAVLGAVPIPTGAPAPPPSTARPGHAAFLAIGGAVLATGPDGPTATVTALGPDITPDPLKPGDPGPPESGVAVLEVHAVARDRPVTLAASDLSGRGEDGHALALTALGPALVAAVPGGPPAVLRVAAPVGAGAAQMTWSPQHTPLALWTFNAELD